MSSSVPRKPGYAQEVMLRVSWSVLNHDDGQPQHARRGEVMLDLGLEGAPSPELTDEEMQQVAFAAKMAALKALAKRPKAKRGRLAYSERQLDRMADDGSIGRLAMKMAIKSGADWPSLDGDQQDEWYEDALAKLRAERKASR